MWKKTSGGQTRPLRWAAESVRVQRVTSTVELGGGGGWRGRGAWQAWSELQLQWSQVETFLFHACDTVKVRAFESSRGRGGEGKKKRLLGLFYFIFLFRYWRIPRDWVLDAGCWMQKVGMQDAYPSAEC